MTKTGDDLRDFCESSVTVTEALFSDDSRVPFHVRTAALTGLVPQFKALVGGKSTCGGW